jgi:hypothetical protein
MAGHCANGHNTQETNDMKQPQPNFALPSFAKQAAVSV